MKSSRLHLCFLLVLAGMAGGVANNLLFTTPPLDVVTLRQAVLDADEEVQCMIEERRALEAEHAREVSRLNEQLISLYSQRPNVATPCFFPELLAQ